MIVPGARVEHADYGIGEVVALLGSVATVDFFGERIDVDIDELLERNVQRPLAPAAPRAASDLDFRRSLEAVNLGVVPSAPEQLISLTIDGADEACTIAGQLARAETEGACRLFMGYYGSGKSHHLQLVKAVALRDGWVTAFAELDPKSADPAKPFTVYQALMSGLSFPARADGTRNQDWPDLVKEIRAHWSDIRALPYVRRSPWFACGLAALLHLSHRRDDADYMAAVGWLAGQVKQAGVMQSLARRAGVAKPPIMPQTKETGLVYGFHLTVLHAIVKALGYRGLAVLIDEAEHVRGYSALRYTRANTFFDVIARCAHQPYLKLRKPVTDYDYNLPDFYKEGPHFALFVGLTEGEDTMDLQRKAGELSVLIHRSDDVTLLRAPEPSAYGRWCAAFLAQAGERLGAPAAMLRDADTLNRLTATLETRFASVPLEERVLRQWTKLAAFAPALLLARRQPVAADELVAAVDHAAAQIAGDAMPWDD